VKKAEDDLLAPQNKAEEEDKEKGEEDKEKGEEKERGKVEDAEAGKSKGEGEKEEGEKFEGEDTKWGENEETTDEMDALESPFRRGKLLEIVIPEHEY